MYLLSSIAVFTSLPLRYFLEWQQFFIHGNRRLTSNRFNTKSGSVKMAEIFSVFSLNGSRDQGHIQWEREIITPMAGTGKLFALTVILVDH